MQMISGGYLIVRAQPKGKDMPLLPAKLISASECICDQFPHPSLIEWVKDTESERQDYLTKMGIDASRFEDVKEWCTNNFGETFGWPSVFYTLDAAKAVKDLFFKDNADISIIGMALPAEYVDRYVEFARTILDEPGHEDWGKSGTLEMIEQNEALADGSNLLGFELLLTEEIGMILHSFMCSSWENDFAQKLKIKPNAKGFLPDLKTAQKCLNELEQHRDDPDVEAGLWLPWAIFEYP